MYRIKLSIAATAISMMCLPSLGGADDKIVTQAQLNQNAQDTLKKADAALNQEYDKLTSTKADDAEGKKKLVEAERLWVKFRDAESESEADDYRGGSIAPMVRSQCAARLTEERAAQLKDREPK